MMRDGKHLEPQDEKTESKESEISEWPQSKQEGGYQGRREGELHEQAREMEKQMRWRNDRNDE